MSAPDDATPYRWRGDALVLHCRVQPNARRDGFAGRRGAQLKLRVAAPPVEGQANARAIAFLAKAFGVPRSRVRLVRGAGGSDKVFVIAAPAVLPEAVATAGC